MDDETKAKYVCTTIEVMRMGASYCVTERDTAASMEKSKLFPDTEPAAALAHVAKLMASMEE